MLHFEQQLNDGRVAHLRFSDASDGDFAIADQAGLLGASRNEVSSYPWTWLHQVHGADVIYAAEPGDGAASQADACVTGADQAVVAVQTADCVPVLFIGMGGPSVSPSVSMVAAAHAGWRGAVAGVLPRTIETLREHGCTELQAIVGPAIGPECYEFGESDLETAVEALGERVRSATSEGSPALDLVAGVIAQLSSLGVETVSVDQCTACTGSYFSHRARGDKGRQVAAAWIDSQSLGHPSP